MERNIYEYNPNVIEAPQSATLSTSSLMTKVYLWMTMALAVTGMTAFYVAGSNESLLYTIASSRGLFWGILIAELALVWILSANIMRLSFAVAGLMFVAYSVLNGVTMSYILFAFDKSSVATTFLVTAGTFAVMSVVGLTIKKDLSAFGRLLIMVLFGLIIATVVNMFVASSTLDWALTYIGVFLFCGLTAYDTQKMKEILRQSAGAGDTNMLKIALLCSLLLYLDFINLFLYLLRIFGDRRS